jgi:hypothetical protein
MTHNLLISNGGAERDRTVGLLNAIQALSQLSYSPTGSKSNTEKGKLSKSSVPELGILSIDSGQAHRHGVEAPRDFESMPNHRRFPIIFEYL